ncbi:ferredoxin [Polaromonas sp. P1(28)-8]|nr:ferredoxin [Polaromonas sp. P1(28)-8]
MYKLDADGLVYLDTDVVPPELEEEAREGAAACPAEALVVEAVSGLTRPVTVSFNHMGRFEGKVALISGTGGGQGRAAAAALRSRGFEGFWMRR